MEIQDAMFGGGLRAYRLFSVVLAVLCLVVPLQIGGDGVVWIWDAWSGDEAFFLVPLGGAVVLAVLSWLESVPGAALGAAAAAVAGGWMAASPDSFGGLFPPYGAGDDTRLLVARIAFPVLLAGLAGRRNLHRSVAARVLIGLGAAGVVAVFAVPFDDRFLFSVAAIDPIADGSVPAILVGVPMVLAGLASAAAPATLAASVRSHGGLHALAGALFHGITLLVALGPAFVVSGLLASGEVAAVDYATFALPVRIASLYYLCLLWIGHGGGALVAGLEAWARRQPVTGYRTMAVMGMAPGVGVSAPPPRPASAALPMMPSAAPSFAPPVVPSVPPPPFAAVGPVVSPSIPGEGPLPPPPGFQPLSLHTIGVGGAPSAAPVVVPAEEPLEIAAHQALPLIEPSRPPPAVEAAVPEPVAPTPVALVAPTASAFVPPSARVPAPPPSVPGIRTARAAHKQTQLGMPAVDPALSAAAQSGRTGDTSLGLPAARAASGPREASRAPSQRLWPPPGGFAPGKDVPASRPTASPGSARPSAVPSAVPAPVRLASSSQPAASRASVSDLQRQLARGNISAEEYQRRLDDILKGT
jgi:hypothetical protein